VGGEGGSMEATVAALKKENDDLLIEIKDIEAEEVALRHTCETLETKLRDTQSREEANTNTLTETITSLEQQVTTLKDQLRSKEVSLEARQVEIHTLLTDNRQLMSKLEQFGITVQLGESGLTFIDQNGLSTPRSSLTPPIPRNELPANPSFPETVAEPAPALTLTPSPPVKATKVASRVQSRPRRSSKVIAEAAAARGDMQALLTLDVDDLLG